MTYSVACRDKNLLIGKRTLVMGIVNVTPDSFSDGGKFLDTKRAVEHADFLINCGADIIDIGGESSRPFAEGVTVDEELARVIPVIKELSGRVSVPISIDTTKAVVAEEAVIAGASIINDISALYFDPYMIEVAVKYGTGVILMHMRGNPQNMQLNLEYDDFLSEVKLFLSNSINRAISAGIKKSSIIIDPGLGFGKTVRHNLDIIKHLGDFSIFKIPVLIGPSRKMFIREVLKSRSRESLSPVKSIVEIGTQASIAAAYMFGADIVRVHDVLSTRATLDIMRAIEER